MLLFSLAAAFLLTWLMGPPAAEDGGDFPFSRQLAGPYRLLRELLQTPFPTLRADPASVSASSESAGLRALARIVAADGLRKGGEYVRALETLAETGAGEEGYAAERALRVRLGCLFKQNRCAEFLAGLNRQPAPDDDLAVQRIVCLARSGRSAEAVRSFRELFRRGRLLPWQEHLDGALLNRWLAGLDEDFWQDKFAWLVAQREAGEFRAEAPHARRFPHLLALTRGEFAYARKEWGAMATHLRSVRSDRYRLRRDALLFKTRLRRDGEAALEEGLDRFRAEPGLYRRLMFDVASLLLAQGLFQRALPALARFREPGGERDEEYWRSLWTSAWIHYRLGDRDQALPFFRQGSHSPHPAYRIASIYWRDRLEGSPPGSLENYPFSYYTVRRITDPARYRPMIKRFSRLFKAGVGPRLETHWRLLRDLLALGWADEARGALAWALRDPGLGETDRRLLQLADSIVLWRSGDYQRAFLRLRRNLGTIEELRLPDFLSGLVLPTFFRPEVEYHSRLNRLDPWLVMALIREESFFLPSARSQADARGLMQLLPSTAFDIARAQELPVSQPDLLVPEINIRLGTAHLRTLLDRYGDRVPLVLAAYNAGERRVDEWLRMFPEASDDEFIEMIPFTETRNYVKNILRNQFFYKYYHEKN